MQNKWRVMPRTYIPEPARRPIKLRIEQRHKAIAGHVAVKESVQSRAQFLGRKRRRRQAAHGRLQIRHQQRRRQTLSSNIGYAQPASFAVKGKHIEIVPADHASGLPRASNFVSWELGYLLR